MKTWTRECYPSPGDRLFLVRGGEGLGWGEFGWIPKAGPTPTSMDERPEDATSPRVLCGNTDEGDTVVVMNTTLAPQTIS